MKKGDRFQCFLTTGGDQKLFKGVWEIKSITTISITIERVLDEHGDERYQSYGFDEKVLKLRLDNRCRHSFHDWGDGTFTVYPDRGGTPFFFESVE